MVKKSRNILANLSKRLNGFESTKWLKASNDKLGGSSPADLMLEGDTQKVELILESEIRRLKSKKK